MSKSDEEVRRVMKTAQEHDQDSLGLKCAYCGSANLTERAEASYHNHPPFGMYLDEIWECEDCGGYSIAIYRLEKVVQHVG